MALHTSGAISLNDIHVEAGGTSGTTAAINDSDIRGLIGKASGATMSFSEWYGASSMVWDMETYVFDTASSSSGTASASATLYLRTDMTWDSYGSGSDTNNAILPEEPGPVFLWYRLISKGSSITGTGTSTTWKSLSSGDVYWWISATANGKNPHSNKDQDVTFELATSSSGSNAEKFTCRLRAVASYTGTLY